MSGRRHWQYDEDDDDDIDTGEVIPVPPEVADALYEEFLSRTNGD